MLTPFAADSTEADVQAFVSGYQAAYNATPDQFAASGYDTIYAIKAAVEKAGVTSADADFSSKVVAAMTSIEVDGVTGTMTWGANGETTKAAQAMIIHDGVASLYAAG
jgi:branched-chain amino acid transport system substrate-binding protein